MSPTEPPRPERTSRGPNPLRNRALGSELATEDHDDRVHDPTRSLLGEEQFAWLQQMIRTDSSPFIPATAMPRAIGALVVGYYKDSQLIYAGRVGTGYTHTVARDLWKRLAPRR